MRIKLKPPYEADFRVAYLTTSPKGLRMVSLVPKGETKPTTGTTLSRYMMETHLGRKLSQGEVVSHINNNPKDDILENLEVLTVEQNLRKRNMMLNKVAVYNHYICGCGKRFSRRASLCKSTTPSCSQKCSMSRRWGKIPTSTLLYAGKPDWEVNFKVSDKVYDLDDIKRYILTNFKED